MFRNILCAFICLILSQAVNAQSGGSTPLAKDVDRPPRVRSDGELRIIEQGILTGYYPGPLPSAYLGAATKPVSNTAALLTASKALVLLYAKTADSTYSFIGHGFFFSSYDFKLTDRDRYRAGILTTAAVLNKCDTHSLYASPDRPVSKWHPEVTDKLFPVILRSFDIAKNLAWLAPADRDLLKFSSPVDLAYFSPRRSSVPVFLPHYDFRYPRPEVRIAFEQLRCDQNTNAFSLLRDYPAGVPICEMKGWVVGITADSPDPPAVISASTIQSFIEAQSPVSGR